MVHTTFAEAHRYLSLNPRLAAALEALEALMKGPFLKGRHDVNAEDVYVNAVEYDTKPEEECCFEAHRDYIDVMLLLSGEEYIGYTPIGNLSSIKSEYSKDGDFLLAGLEPGMTKLKMAPHDVCIFFPEDAHAPSMEVSGKSHVQKFIAKVRV